MSRRKHNLSKKRPEPHLRVYRDRSVLVFEDGSEIVFEEGRPSQEAQERYNRIVNALRANWLETLYVELPTTIDAVSLDDQATALLDQIVDAVTSEVGRAVVGLTILQLIVKCLEPRQSIRLHKGGTGDFSWREGISMRRLDARFVTPFLRRHGLLRINKDGLFMTRSLAENYPYTQFYKAAVRGAKQAWLDIIDLVEADALNSCDALKYLLAKLRNRADHFREIAEHALRLTQSWLDTQPTPVQIRETILQHINTSGYSARLLEVSMHTFLQTLEDHNALQGRLLPLCQMRTANKKHRNIADVEIVSDQESVIEAWDAKYGKPYLLDELYELAEKLEGKAPEVVGFVVERAPDLRRDILDAKGAIQEATGVEIQILSLEEWLNFYFQRTNLIDQQEAVFRAWAIAYIEILCQKRRNRAPIDEPADQWVEDWIQLLRVKA
ncbi:MAG: hypothetical protein N2554_07660 [Fimbriimonadales bacterium]|nr:hypothetical protein [Fimbriimonadales bacterium]